MSMKKIINVLVDFGFDGYDISETDFTEKDRVVQLGVAPNRIDIITGVSGLEFDESFLKRKILEVENIKVNFISLHHLRINKKATGRDKDIIDLKNLPEE